MPASLLPTSIPLFFPLSLFLIAMASSGKKNQFIKINFTYQIHLCQHLHPIPGKHDFHLFYFSPIPHQVRSQYLLQDHYTNHLLTATPPKKKEKKLKKISHCSRNQHFITFQYTVTRFKRIKIND